MGEVSLKQRYLHWCKRNLIKSGVPEKEAAERTASLKTLWASSKTERDAMMKEVMARQKLENNPDITIKVLLKMALAVA
jgi:hypothetical protein